MKFLKNRRAWSLWVGMASVVNQKEIPVEFPCFGYLECVSFGYEEERALYLYAADLERMAAQAKAAREEAQP